MMFKMQNKMQSLDTNFAEEVRRLNESFQQLKTDLPITKNVNKQLYKRFVKHGEAMLGKYPVSLETMRWDCGIYPVQFQKMNLKKLFVKLWKRFESKLMIEILNPPIVSAVKSIKLLNSAIGKTAKKLLKK